MSPIQILPTVSSSYIRASLPILASYPLIIFPDPCLALTFPGCANLHIIHIIIHILHIPPHNIICKPLRISIFLKGFNEGIVNLPTKIITLGKGHLVDWKQAYQELKTFYKDMEKLETKEEVQGMYEIICHPHLQYIGKTTVQHYTKLNRLGSVMLKVVWKLDSISATNFHLV